MLCGLIGREPLALIYDVCFTSFLFEGNHISLVAQDIVSEPEEFEVYGVKVISESGNKGYLIGEKGKSYKTIFQRKKISNIGLIKCELSDEWAETGERFQMSFVSGVILEVEGTYFPAYTKPYGYGFFDHGLSSLVTKTESLKLALNGGEFYQSSVKWCV